MASFEINMFILICFATLMICVSSDWSYEGNHGVSEWPGLCNTGTRQSPINIPISRSKKVYSSDRLVFTNYDRSPEVEKIYNSGHSVTFEIEDSTYSYPKLSGGGLNGEYQFAHFHFHWGHEDNLGSEHKFEDQIFPMEMHLVHFKTAYGDNIAEAISKSDAWDTLAVVGVMFEVAEEDNHNFDHIVEELKFVRHAHQEVRNVTVFPLKKVLPSNIEEFYRYNGSLTTPDCKEIVVWTIFKNPVAISENQLNEFRELFDTYEESPVQHKEYDNFRGVQPLNDRPILDYSISSAEAVFFISGIPPWTLVLATASLKWLLVEN